MPFPAVMLAIEFTMSMSRLNISAEIGCPAATCLSCGRISRWENRCPVRKQCRQVRRLKRQFARHVGGVDLDPVLRAYRDLFPEVVPAADAAADKLLG